jgi:hypothetical protein
VGATAEFTFGNKLSRVCWTKKHCHKPWFDVECHIAKHELKLWLKANPDSHFVKHQKNKLKILLKRKKNSWETVRAQHMCMLTKVDAFSF